MAAQSLRRSQFITTYGPGAILEGPEGPRIIPILDQSGLFDRRNPSDFEITDMRLSQTLLNDARIIRLPSNAEVRLPDTIYIYDTRRFPTWSLCLRHNLLYRKSQPDNMACPRCDPLPNRYDAWRQAGRQSIRFVRACRAGHIDDVDWTRIIPHTTENCHPNYLFWRGGGGALRHIYILCPNCQASINLGQAYSRDWHCSGRFPEFGTNRPGCDEPSRLIQRGAANLRIAEILTALTIPPHSTQIHRILQTRIIHATLITSRPQNKQELLEALQSLADHNHLSPAILVELDNYDEEPIMQAIEETLADDSPSTSQNFRLQEFQALRHAAAHGAPPQPSPTPGAPPQFEIVQSHVRTLTCSNGHCLRITPVNRLRVVMVQTGYRRLDPLNQIIERVYHSEQLNWYPGVELFGEGIFIDFIRENIEVSPSQHFDLQGSANSWFDAWIDPASFEQNIHPEEQNELHPVFVWWHTLSHRLIKALAIDSGYSSAAVRERVYIDVNGDSGNAVGGVLLYTAQPGGDGTLGGLVALVPEFERVLNSAIRHLDTCSNDPLCGDEVFSPGKSNGAACYSCGFVSETSCEHRNMRLDRNLLLENLP